MTAYPMPVNVTPVSRDKYLQHLRNKRLCLDVLCEAAKNYLGFELDAEIAELENPPEAPDPAEFIRYGSPYAHSPESLIRANEAVQGLEHQLEMLDKIKDTPAAEYMGPLVDAMYKPMLEQQLESAQRYRDEVQKSMENAAQEQQVEPEGANS